MPASNEIPTFPLAAFRELAQRLWAWGRVTAHKELGMANYPKITDDERRRALKRLGAVPDVANAYLDIERCLKDQPPIVRGLLWTLYAKRHAQLHTTALEVEPSCRLHISDFVDTCYGDLISEGERRTLERVAGRIKAQWCRAAIHELGLNDLANDGQDIPKAA